MAEVKAAGQSTADAAERNPGATEGKSSHKAEQLAEEAKKTAGEMGHRASEAAISRIDSRRSRLAEDVHGVGEALRLSAQQRRQSGESAGTGYVERLAGQVERVSDYLERNDAREMMRETEHFARQNQGLFLGGAFALGVLGARFLKSSPPNGSRMESQDSGSMRASVQRGREADYDGVRRRGAPGYEAPMERTTSAEDAGTAPRRS